jgi:hypothetical protein
MGIRNNPGIDESKMPRWQIRRWRLFKRALEDKTFLELLPDLSSDYQDNDSLPTKYTIGAVRAFRIPGECTEAFYALLGNPELINQQSKLVDLIRPPVQYLSFRHKVMGMSEEPKARFKHWQASRKKEAIKSGQDILELSEGLLLEVQPYTTKQELMDFIDGFFDSHLKPLLSKSDSPFTPEELRKGRIRKPSKVRARVLELHKDGKTPIEIEKALGYKHWASNISKIISEAKKPH